MIDVLIGFGALVGLLVLFPLVNWMVWAVIPPLSPRALARKGQFVSIDGIETYCERYGAGPPLILIPPGGSHTGTWRYNIPALSRAHTVWTLDLPGSGYSDKPETFAYTHRAYARFVRDFMTTMGIAKAAVGGHSLGGTVALEFALDFPEQTAGLILISAGGYSRGRPLGLLNPLRYALTHAILMSFSSYRPVVRLFYRYLYDDPSAFYCDSGHISEICAINRTPRARAAWYWMLRGLNFDFALPDPSRIKSVAVPTLIVWGREDRVVDVKIAARFQTDIAGALMVIVDHAGHNVHEEKPDTVNRAVESFLATIRW